MAAFHPATVKMPRQQESPMPCNLHIVRAGDFVRLDAHGELDSDASGKILRTIAKTCIDRGIDNALLDVRNFYSNVTIAQLHDLTRTFYEMGFREKHHLAVLHRYRGGKKAELFAMFAESHGWNVRAFDLFEDAIEWFSEDEQVRARELP
jgi:hypothetical protein